MENKVSSELPKKRDKSSAYPQFSLERCIDFAGKIFEMGPRHVLLDQAAKAAGYKNKGVGPFFGLRAAARYFGFVGYDKEYISVTEPVIKVLLEKSREDKGSLVRKAILLPTLYGKIFDNFVGKQLPDEEDLARRLSVDEQYGISKDASKNAAKIFFESIRFAGLLDNNNYLKSPDEDVPRIQEKDETEILEEKLELGEKEEFQRIHLDKYEITLQGGVRISLSLPPTLSQKDKERLKTMIDLVPEDLDPRRS
ncbi:MAG TPA: hypothetical protein VLZ03_09720 [Thermodesulfobacteriota bacterium]|nr:hypothetical protein [Thermodesulfobacteriota bacterium]